MDRPVLTLRGAARPGVGGAAGRARAYWHCAALAAPPLSLAPRCWKCNPVAVPATRLAGSRRRPPHPSCQWLASNCSRRGGRRGMGKEGRGGEEANRRQRSRRGPCPQGSAAEETHAGGSCARRAACCRLPALHCGNTLPRSIVRPLCKAGAAGESLQRNAPQAPGDGLLADGGRQVYLPPLVHTLLHVAPHVLAQLPAAT